jgi:hypothetical protein
VNLGPDVALEIVQLAHQYMLPRLKRMCEERVTQNGDFDVESCVEVFRFAEIRDANLLKKHCLDFMAKRADALINTPSIASKIDAALLQGMCLQLENSEKFQKYVLDWNL